MTDVMPGRSAAAFDLEAKYREESGSFFFTGVQALVRVPMDQMRADRKAGHRMMARQNIGCIIGHFGAQMCCNGGAVNQLCGHTGDPLSLRLFCRAASSRSG